MLPYLQTALLSIVSLLATLVGLCLLVTSPFLFLLYLDLPPPPSWLNPWTVAGLGLLLTALGVWLWILAWRRWLPKEKNR